jgi:rRNA maturation endonuclease Nob1
MTDTDKMVCPDCGAEMNLHAEKVDYTEGGESGEGFDPDLGGRLEEFHTCPECGHTLSRRAR